MSDLRIESLRGGLVESTSTVSVAVSDASGRLLAAAGDPGRVTFMRSAAKPFQAIPLVADGALERFGITAMELALACASHNSERRQVQLVAAWLHRIGCRESDLACGPHKALAKELAIADPENPVEPDVAPPSPLASNCSGKHTGMLALALHHGWEIAGYHRAEHPVQRRMLRELSQYVDLREQAIGVAVDGCGVVTFAVPLVSMALGFARLVASQDSAPRTIVSAMVSHPELVGGAGRLCTELMQDYEWRVLAKVGAEGVYGAALIDRGIGIALKVEDGNAPAANVALLAVLHQLGIEPPHAGSLSRFGEPAVLNTRLERVGVMRAAGSVEFV